MCRSLTVRFEATTALDGLDLTVAAGQITAVMGPSGSGKSTLLRVVAGLQTPDSGTVHWRGKDITGLAAHRRGFGLMFQDFALFPHRNVAENVEFGLRMQRWTDEERRRRLATMLDVVGLAGYADRAVDQLSGGEQQRVALARTLAPRPELVMLDEPLGSLDRALRDRLLTEMRSTFADLGVTALYVTHDQEEALTIGDTIAVMRAGRIEAMGSGEELWLNPQTASVARLLGHDNVLPAADAARIGIAPHGAAWVAVTSDSVGLTADDEGEGTVTSVRLRNGRLRYEIELAGIRLVSTLAANVHAGERVSVSIPAAAAIRLSE